MSENGTDIGVARRKEIGGTATSPATDGPTRFVRRVMHRGIVTFDRSTTAAELARTMISSRIHCVAVSGVSRDEREDPRVWGISPTSTCWRRSQSRDQIPVPERRPASPSSQSDLKHVWIRPLLP